MHQEYERHEPNGDHPITREIPEEVLQAQVDRLQPTVSQNDLMRFGGYTAARYGELDTHDRYWALVHTRTNKLMVEGVVRIIAGRTAADELSPEETRQLIELASPTTLDRMDREETN